MFRAGSVELQESRPLRDTNDVDAAPGGLCECAARSLQAVNLASTEYINSNRVQKVSRIMYNT